MYELRFYVSCRYYGSRFPGFFELKTLSVCIKGTIIKRHIILLRIGAIYPPTYEVVCPCAQ